MQLLIRKIILVLFFHILEHSWLILQVLCVFLEQSNEKSFTVFCYLDWFRDKAIVYGRKEIGVITVFRKSETVILSRLCSAL